MAEKRKRKITTKLASVNAYKRDVSSTLLDTEFQTLLRQKTQSDNPKVICEELEKLDSELTNRIKTAYGKIKTTP
eukprot:7194521-Ditylum_brightwellii.AAC.1